MIGVGYNPTKRFKGKSGVYVKGNLQHKVDYYDLCKLCCFNLHLALCLDFPCTRRINNNNYYRWNWIKV